jgi:hypothetical protein
MRERNADLCESILGKWISFVTELEIDKGNMAIKTANATSIATLIYMTLNISYMDRFTII